MDDARSAGSAWLPSARRLVSWASRDSERRWARELCGVGVQGIAQRCRGAWASGVGLGVTTRTAGRGRSWHCSEWPGRRAWRGMGEVS